MTTKRDGRILELYGKGWGAARIARELGLTEWRVRVRLESLLPAPGHGGRRAPAGRGPRNTRVTFAVSDDELEAIRAAAGDRPLAEWLREVVLAALPKP